MEFVLDRQQIDSNQTPSSPVEIPIPNYTSNSQKTDISKITLSTIKFPSISLKTKSQIKKKSNELNKNKQTRNKNNVPDILRNMPTGLFGLFGTGDNSTRRFKSRRQHDDNKLINSQAQLTAGLIDSAAFGPSQPSLPVPCRGSYSRSGAGTPASYTQGVRDDNVPLSDGGVKGGTINMFNPEYYHSEGSQQLSTTNVYVGGIPRHYTERELHAVFKVYGPLQSVYITRAGTVAFIQFEKTADAKQAIESQNQVVPPTGKWPWIVKYANYNVMVSQRQQQCDDPVVNELQQQQQLSRSTASTLTPDKFVAPNPHALSNIVGYSPKTAPLSSSTVTSANITNPLGIPNIIPQMPLLPNAAALQFGSAIPPMLPLMLPQMTQTLQQQQPLQRSQTQFQQQRW